MDYLGSKKVSWLDVVQCVWTELFPILSASISKCIQKKLKTDDTFTVHDFDEDTVNDIIELLGKRRTMNSKEIEYLRALIKRAIVHFDDLKYNVKVRDEDKDSDEYQSLHPKWPKLNNRLISDIYGVHKALMFGQCRTEFTNDDFRKLWQKAQRDEFKERIQHEAELSVSFYPLYLVKDDLFTVMACHFAVSYAVNEMIKDRESLRFLSVVIPVAICSRYDEDELYQSTIEDLDEFLRTTSSTANHILLKVNPQLETAQQLGEDIANAIKAFHHDRHDDHDKMIVILFCRQSSQQNHPEFTYMHIFEVNNGSALDELLQNYFLSIDFDIRGHRDTDNDSREDLSVTTGNTVRCWLHFGKGQKLRFYPEYVVWVIPQLFLRSTTKTPYQSIQTIYSDRYKHGWRVSLDDDVFNRYYHLITGYKHISNNYHRTEVALHKERSDKNESGLRDKLVSKEHHEIDIVLHQFVEDQEFDSDAILGDVVTERKRIDGIDSNIATLLGPESANFRKLKFAVFQNEDITCKHDAVRHVDDCEHIDTVICNLQKFREYGMNIDASNVVDFDLDSIISSFDHLVNVHHFLVDDLHKKMIQKFISRRVRCEHGAKCDILRRHSTRTRERDHSENDEVEVEPSHAVDAFIESIIDTLLAIHCYALHHENHLYRLMSGENDSISSRFSTDVHGVKTVITIEPEDDDEHKDDEKENDKPIDIDFGRNVLCWLPHDQRPRYDSLRNEIIQNPDSNIDRDLWEKYEMICSAKIKGTKYKINEMMSLKLYSDSTKMQFKLRRAHWTVSDLNVHKSYYHWAMGLYEAHLYHAKPVPTAFGSKDTPCKLWHGLSKLFTMSQEVPIYHGPISTTVANAVARGFSKNQGLIWLIQSTFVNPLRFCVGIQMQWISSFKHEKEVLLYNQFLLIQSTETFDDDAKVLVDHLMYTLHSRETAIMDRKAFWKHLGVRFSRNWIPLIASHQLLFAKSNYKELEVRLRLANELQIPFFYIFDWIRRCTVNHDDTVVILRDENAHPDLNLSQYAFTFGFGANGNVDDTFEPLSLYHAREIALPCKLTNDDLQLEYNIFCKPTDNSHGNTPIHSMLLRRYNLDDSAPITLDQSAYIARSVRRSEHRGNLILESASDVLISSKTVIKGHEVDDGTGGDVRIVSKGTVTNQGTVQCEDVYIVADSFINEGKLNCVESGEINIFCREFVNSGSINPAPNLYESRNGIIEYFLICLLKTSTSSVHAGDFVTKIGFGFKTGWIPLILDNNIWTENQFYIIEGMIHYVQSKFFILMKVIRECLVSDQLQSIVYLNIHEQNIDPNLCDDFIFCIGFGDEVPLDPELLRFDNISDFRIAYNAASKANTAMNLTIFCKAADDSFDFVAIHSWILPFEHLLLTPLDSKITPLTRSITGSFVNEYKIADKIDVLDYPTYYWYSAQIIQIDVANKQAFKVRYDGFGHERDEWILFTKQDRIAPHKSKSFGNGKREGGVHVLVATKYGQSPIEGADIRAAMDPKSRLQLIHVECLMSGYMFKKGKRNNQWKKRWAVIRSDGLRYYIKKNLKVDDYRGFIAFSEIRKIEQKLADAHTPHSFDIQTASRKYYFSCQTDEDLKDWMCVIQCLMIHKVEDICRQRYELCPRPSPIPSRARQVAFFGMNDNE